MKYYDKNKINKEKRFIKIKRITMLILLIFMNLVAKAFRKETISIKGDIIYIIIVLIVIALYYKGNRIAFKIILLIVPFLFIILVLLIFGTYSSYFTNYQ